MTDLASALESGDSVNVALALRNGGVLVPMLDPDGPPTVRVFRRGESDEYMMLLFSTPEAYAAAVPDEGDLASEIYDAVSLLDFLTKNEHILETVWFDIAGPHSMQATPADLIAALTLPRS